MTQLSTGLTPLDPGEKARRKRQNRVIWAVIVMVVVPAVSYFGATGYAESKVRAWTTGPSVAFNQSTSVYLDHGDYVVWTYLTKADCSVWYGNDLVSTKSSSSESVANFHASVDVTATHNGDYTVLCSSEFVDGHAIVSTPSPLSRVAMIMMAGYGIGFAALVTGFVLLIVAVTTNANEKRIITRPPPPGWPPGGPYPPRQPHPHQVHLGYWQ